MSNFGFPEWSEEDQQWRSQAACSGMSTELFFPARGETVQPIKAVCKRCPVTAECLEFALSIPETFGIWGGLSERERRKIRMHRNRIRREEQDDARGNRSATG